MTIKRWRWMTKQVFTTHDVAAICAVAPRTVCMWSSDNLLPMFRVPGSTHRRVSRSDLIQFLRKYEIPIPVELIEPPGS